MSGLFASLYSIFCKASVMIFKAAVIVLKHGTLMVMSLAESFFNWAKIKFDKIKNKR